MRPKTKDLLKMKLFDSAIPFVVGMTMLGVTFMIVGKVREDILGIAEEAATNAVDKAFAKTEPTISWISAKALKPEVTVGGVLEIEYMALIRKQCPSDLRSFLLNETTDVAAYRFPDQSGGYRREDRSPQIWRVKIVISDPPPGSGFPPLEPGDYRYRTTAIRYCDRIELDSSIPDVVFKLIR